MVGSAGYCECVRHVKFIFVVPASIFGVYSIQRFVSRSEKGRKLMKLNSKCIGGCNIVQYALCVDVGVGVDVTD